MCSNVTPHCELTIPLSTLFSFINQEQGTPERQKSTLKNKNQQNSTVETINNIVNENMLLNLTVLFIELTTNKYKLTITTMKILNFDDNSKLTEITIGELETDNHGCYKENTVQMSASNFKKILDIIPKTSKGLATQNVIRNIKDDLTTLSFVSPCPTGKDVVKLLEQIIKEQSFWNDLDELQELLSKDDKIPPFEGYPAEHIGEINHP